MATRVDPYRASTSWSRSTASRRRDFRSAAASTRPTAVIEYREGNDPNHTRKLSGLNSFSAISLKRGVTDSDELYKWHLRRSTGQRRAQERFDRAAR